ncbi:MAG: aspartate aminotransferase family protein [Gammaproteobacteria bacterium]
MGTYARKPVTFSRGEGVWLYTDSGSNDRYLDALSGIAVCGLGHAHPVVAKAVAEQASKLVHTSNIYQIELQEKLGTKLCQLSGMDAVFFCNSGAEANEAAIKLARLYGHHKNIKTPSIVVMENSFHGRTMATLTATGNRKAHAGFEPLVPGFIRAPFNDIEAISSILDSNTNIAAILVEPIQGEGGINIPTNGYLTNLRTLCDKHEILLMLDEVQTSNGRTGKWFCFQHENIQPDVLAIAKGLGNGIPIGACMAKKDVADLFAPGSHGSTFGGNPLACSAGLATIEIIEKNGLCENAAKLGHYMVERFNEKLSSSKFVKEVRGKGMMIGIELTIPCSQIVDLCLKKKLLVNVTSDSVIRLLPPLILEHDQADTIIDTVVDCVNEFIESQ